MSASRLSPIEIPFGDKDESADYTLHIGDFVQFNIATDRRDRLQRATNIQLLDDTFKVNFEKREMVSRALAASSSSSRGRVCAAKLLVFVTF